MSDMKCELRCEYPRYFVPEHRREEYEDLLGLLLEHASGPTGETEDVAAFVAAACLGQNHLWQDMRLANRGELSLLLARHFRPLFDRNARDMKWKKFFYKQLCEREGLYVCKSPSCGVCSDFEKCFGPE
ncbi:MAG: nitrogen fixation protein NifQ [Nitrospirae bacterium]|nr:nitrogen fixation protein NifQ [Nitrospirota bacterium]